MAFTKLILLLAALTFGAVFQKGQLYFSGAKVSKDGVITIEIGNQTVQDYVTQLEEIAPINKSIVDDYKALEDEDVDSFNLVADDKATFDALKTSAFPPEFLSCVAVGIAHSSDLYNLLGYTVKAVAKADIVPSITWLIKQAPTRVDFTIKGKNATDEEKKFYTQIPLTFNCLGLSLGLASYSIARGGVGDAGCYANDKVPKDNKCTVEGGSTKTYLEGYKIGYYFHADSATLKQLVARFGAVDDALLGLIVGWEKDGDKEKWIRAVKIPILGTKWQTLEISNTFSEYTGRVIGSSFASVRAALSLIAAAVVIPALLL